MTVFSIQLQTVTVRSGERYLIVEAHLGGERLTHGMVPIGGEGSNEDAWAAAHHALDMAEREVRRQASATSTTCPVSST